MTGVVFSTGAQYLRKDLIIINDEFKKLTIHFTNEQLDCVLTEEENISFFFKLVIANRKYVRKTSEKS